MQDLMSNAGNIFEELKEADMISCKKDDDIRTITAEGGGIWTILCC